MRISPRFGFGIRRQAIRNRRPPFDTVAASLYAALGLRRLVSTWTGPLVTVRRDSDNATLDVGATATTGRLDTAALIAFAGTGSAFVTQWWDQTGNGRLAIQPTAAAQPRLVNAGVLDRLGATPAFVFDGEDDYLVLQNAKGLARNTGFLTIALSASVAAVSNSTYLRVYDASGATWIEIRVLNASSLLLGGRRLSGGDYQSVSGGPVEARRVIGRARYADAMADLVLDGALTSGAFLTPGLTSDADSSASPRIGQGASSSYAAMSLTSLVLSRSNLDATALDAALAETLT